jgi:solute carrier family 25 citrate transporter 1
VAGETALSRFMSVTSEMFRNEGASAFYKGITPRVLRVAPGQAIVFTVSIAMLGLECSV